MVKVVSLLGGALCAAALGTSSASSPEAFPTGPITIIVPYPVGGGVDTMARLLGASLQAKWGHPVVVENRAGGNGTVGAQVVSRAKPDGHTLFFAAEGPLIVNQHLYSKLNYDPTAFAPVTIVCSAPFFVSVGPSVPVNTLAELFAYAKANPETLRYGTSGIGAPGHLSAIMLEMKQGLRFTAIPYKGVAPAVNDFIAGHTNMLFALQTSAGPFFNTEKMKVLAVTSRQRHPSFPNVPTVAETVPGFSSETAVMVVAPPGTPEEITTKISSAMAEAIKSPSVKKKIDELGSTPIANTPAEAGIYLKEESRRWGEVIRAANLKMD